MISRFIVASQGHDLTKIQKQKETKRSSESYQLPLEWTFGTTIKHTTDRIEVERLLWKRRK